MFGSFYCIKLDFTTSYPLVLSIFYATLACCSRVFTVFGICLLCVCLSSSLD